MKSLLKSSSVLIVSAVIFVVGYFRNGSTLGHPVLHVFLSFLLGMLSMYIASRVKAGYEYPVWIGGKSRADIEYNRKIAREVAKIYMPE